MQSSENSTKSPHESEESEQHVLNFLDSMDRYLILMDSLASSLRQGWLELASARHSMGAFRVSSVLFDLKSHHASTKLQVHDGDPNMEVPCFTLSKWVSSDDSDKHSEKPEFEEDGLLQNESNNGRQTPNHDTSQSRKPLEGRVSGGSPVTPDRQAQRERFKTLSMFGTLVSPKLRASQLSFETALEMLIEIANVRASLLCGYEQVRHDQKTAE